MKNVFSVDLKTQRETGPSVPATSHTEICDDTYHDWPTESVRVLSGRRGKGKRGMNALADKLSRL